MRIAYFTGQEVGEEEAGVVDAVITKPVTMDQLSATIATIPHMVWLYFDPSSALFDRYG